MWDLLIRAILNISEKQIFDYFIPVCISIFLNITSTPTFTAIVAVVVVVIIIIIIIYSFRVFHVSVSWWSFTGVEWQQDIAAFIIVPKHSSKNSDQTKV